MAKAGLLVNAVAIWTLVTVVGTLAGLLPANWVFAKSPLPLC